MRRPFALFSRSEPSRHMRSSAGFIIATFGFKFSDTQVRDTDQ
jgi:hypothetical protein